MAELYQVATGSKKISNLTTISGISGSAVIPVVMSNVVGNTYPITNGTTNQISYEDFRESVIENNANIFTTTQTVRVGSGNSQQQTTLEGHDFIMTTGSLVTPVGTEGFKVQLFANDGTPGAKLYTYDNTEATPANRFKTFMEVGTGYGDISFTRPVSFSSPLTVNNNLVVNGVLTARQVQTSIVTSSVQYESGSTRFGDTFEDTHEFTGSLKVSGSLALNTLTQNRVVYVGSNGTLTDSSAFTFNGTTLGVQAGITTTGYVNINGNGLKVDGVINNPLIGAVTQSLIDIVGGLQSYTASLKSAAIVSSSQQILNYNIFATTGSNTFRANQAITGSLSISNGQFNIITGSGELTSSLSFRHTTIDPITGNATLELRYRNNDVGPENNAWKFMASDSGVALVFEQEGVDRTLLSSNNAGDALIFRDTRLFGKGLTVDNNLLVSQNTQITGSLIVMGGITGSILATNGVVSSSNQLFELNNQTGSQNSINNGIAIVTASLNSFTASAGTSTTNINSFTASQLAVNTLTQAVTSSLITIVGGLQAYTASLKSVAIVSSSNQLFELNNQTGSQNSINNLTLAVTSSLITIVGGLQAYTASLKSVSIVSSSNQLFELNNQTGSQNSINTLTQAVTSSLLTTISGVQSYTASLKGAAIVSSSTQIENYFLFAETSSANTFYGTQEIKGNLNLSNPSPLVYNSGNTNAMLFGFFDGSSIYGPYYQIFGSNYSNVSQRGSAEFVFDSRNGGASGFNIAEFNGSTWLRKFRAGQNGVEVTGSLNVSGSTHTIENGFVILQQVSQSLNFADDTAAAAGGVPLGGLYRNGNFIAIRID